MLCKYATSELNWKLLIFLLNWTLWWRKVKKNLVCIFGVNSLSTGKHIEGNHSVLTTTFPQWSAFTPFQPFQTSSCVHSEILGFSLSMLERNRTTGKQDRVLPFWSLCCWRVGSNRWKESVITPVEEATAMLHVPGV